jgi:hypothetical protein
MANQQDIIGALSQSASSAIGRVGGITVKVEPNAQPTNTSGSAYSTGNSVGGKLTFAGVARTGVGSGIMQSLVLTCKSVQTCTYDLVLFNADPTATTITDKVALTINSADLPKIIGVIHVNDLTSFATNCEAQALNLALPFALPSGTTMYGALVVRGTPTYTSTSDVTISARIIQD